MRKRLEHSAFVKVFVSTCAEFCRKTTIHGLYHLVTQRKLEKLFWLVTVSIAVVLGANLIYMSYMRYENNPVVVSMNKDYFTWNLSFPGTTWCIQNRLDEEKAASLIKRKWNLSGGRQFEEYMDLLRVLSDSNYRNLQEFNRFLRNPNFENLNLQELLLEVNFNYRNFSFVTYTGDSLPYQEILTEEGICYSTSFIAPFMSLNASVRMRPEKQAEPNVCIYYQLPCFARVMDIPRPIKYYIHSPYEIPDSRSKFWLVHENLGTDTYFSFLNIEAHSSLKDLRLQQRKCNLRDEVFSFSESPLYSYQLCQMNCRRRLCMELCNCVPHFYIKREDQPICQLRGLVCLSQYSNYLTSLGADNHTKKYPCDCYPSCSETEFILEKTLYVTSKEFYFSGMRYSWSIDIYPKIAVSRHVIFGFDGLLVNLGGIAGFFVGSSIISAIELVYFFTIRLFRRLIKEYMEGKKCDSESQKRKTVARRTKAVRFQLPKDYREDFLRRSVPDKYFEFKM